MDTDPSAFGVVMDNGPGSAYAWGPFPEAAVADRFAEFATREIDPAHVTPWAEALALPGVRLRDPVAELLAWRDACADWYRTATPAVRKEN